MAFFFVPKNANVRGLSRVPGVLGGHEFDIISDGKTEDLKTGVFYRRIIGNENLNISLTQPPIMTKCGRGATAPAEGHEKSPRVMVREGV